MRLSVSGCHERTSRMMYASASGRNTRSDSRARYAVRHFGASTICAHKARNCWLPRMQ